MAIFPGAVWRPVDSAFLPNKAMAAFNRVNLHIAVSNANSLHGFYSHTGRPSSHFYVPYEGLPEQYVDTADQAEADVEGNDATISIETAGGLDPGTPWTTSQREWLSRIYAWAVVTHGIELKIATSSKIGYESKGLSWHRLGINGNFPELPSPFAGRLQRGGGMRYSTAYGKQCPLAVNILLIPSIFDRACEIIGGAPVPPVVVTNPIPPVTPPPPSVPQIETDGLWGRGTTSRLQQFFGTAQDGEVWWQYQGNAQPAFVDGWVYNYAKGKGSPVVSAIQTRLGVAADGVWGKNTTNALEVHYGYPADGTLDRPSNTVRRMQEALNRNEF